MSKMNTLSQETTEDEVMEKEHFQREVDMDEYFTREPDNFGGKESFI